MEPPFLRSQADFILQLTNSVTVAPRGWAELIGKKFPHARVHRHRRALPGTDLAIESDRAVPGTIVICNSKIGPGVITLFDQFLPDEHQTETERDRMDWLISGLEQIGSHFKEGFRVGHSPTRVTLAVPPIYEAVQRSILETFQERYRGIIEVWLY